MIGKGNLLVYTRKPVVDSYSSYLAGSIHLAYGSDSSNYKALNQNYGILFAPAIIDQNDVIIAKGLKNPYIFHTDDETFGIVAIRTNPDGSYDNDSKGKILLWTSNDLIHFEEKGLIDLKHKALVEKVACKYDPTNKKYQIDWIDSEGNYYRNTILDLENKHSISSVEQTRASESLVSLKDQEELVLLNPPEGMASGNVIQIDKELGQKLLLEWLPLENVAVEVPDTVYVNSIADITSINATATYTDGSTATKQVKWNVEDIDISGPGTYEITGEVIQEEYDFPLAIGYADPDIVKWEDSYYYVATNDHVNNIGIFVREGKTVAELFQEGFEEHLILDKDESRGLVQTFWAPEFHVIDNQMHILFAVSGNQWGPQCHVMKLKKGGNITDPGSWTDPIRVIKQDGSNLTDDGITLDMTYFEVNKISYVSWSYRSRIGQPDDTGSMLYIATVDPCKPWKLTSEPVLLSRPLYGWENIEGTINNEGSYPLITKDYVHLTYSGGAANGYTYALGMLSIKKGENLLDVTNWKKNPTPVLSYYSIEGEYGPGHNAFYINEDGDVMITYHAEPVMKGHMRSTGIRRVHFDINNKPRFDMSLERDLKKEFTKVKMNVVI